MRKLIPTIALACFAIFALNACDKTGQPEQAAEQTAAVLPIPTNPGDKAAWKQYLVQEVTANMAGVKSNHPYMYFVPAGDDDESANERKNQLANVATVVSRGVLPGNMMAFGGPDSKLTAQLIIDSFKDVQVGSFKDVVVLFVGAPAEADGVKQALASSGADVRFVEAK